MWGSWLSFLAQVLFQSPTRALALRQARTICETKRIDKTIIKPHLLVQVTIVRSEIPALLVVVTTFSTACVIPVPILKASVLIALTLITTTAPRRY
jgi:hypothetical protein